MAAKKFDRRQSEMVLREVASLWAQGRPSAQIAEAVGVSVQQARHYIRKLRRQWAAERDADVSDRIAHLLAQNTEVVRNAWKGWERSKVDGTKKRETVDADNKTTTITTTWGRCGDTRYLQVILSCLNFEADLLGLKAPRKITPTTANGEEMDIKVYVGIDPGKV